MILVLATLGLTLYLSAEVRTERLVDLERHLLNDATLMANTLSDRSCKGPMLVRWTIRPAVGLG